MSASSDEKADVIHFSVKNLVGDVSVYKCGSIQDLRMRLALEAGLLFPCILLFRQSDHTMLVEDAVDFEINNQLYFINNEHGVRRDIADWSSQKWIQVLKCHIYRYGDEHVARHAKGLISGDPRGFGKKMRDWGTQVMRSPESSEDVDFLVDLIRIMAVVQEELGDDGNTCILVDAPDHYGRTLLHIAAGCNHRETRVLQALLECERVDVNARTQDGVTPLLVAVEKGRVATVRALLVAGAHPGSRAADDGDEHWTPLHVAAALGHFEMASLLVDAGADVNAPSSGDGAVGGGKTPLYWASTYGHAHVIQLLLHAGANEDVRGEYGLTPYGMAGVHGKV